MTIAAALLHLFRAACALAAACYLAPLLAGFKRTFNDLSTLEMRCPHEGL